MKRKIFELAIIIFFCPFLTLAQEVIVTVTAEDLHTPVSLDSIQIANISNGSSKSFPILPSGIVDYRINLSTGKILAIDDAPTQKAWGISQIANIPGMTWVRAILPDQEVVTLRTVDLTGKTIKEHRMEVAAGDHIIAYGPMLDGIGMLVIESQRYRECFKVIGGNYEIPPVIGSYSLLRSLPTMTRALYSPESGFIFTPGDSVRFNVFQKNYHSTFIVRAPVNNDWYRIPLCPSGIITDMDGNEYHTVAIGEQCWMKENMNSTHYATGTSLTDGTGAGNIISDTATRYWFFYNDDPANGPVYGRLYTWIAAMNGSYNLSGSQGLCPNGWHIPSDGEWMSLELFLGMTQAQVVQIMDWRGTVEGGVLKEEGTTHWMSPNEGATNATGFSALPGGIRDPTETFWDLTKFSYYWTSDMVQGWYPIIRGFGFDTAEIYRTWYYTTHAASVRCIRD